MIGFLPVWLQQAAGVLICVVAIICVFPGCLRIAVLLERKGLGRMQNRLGPNRVGPLGIFQPVADGIKSLTKEDIVPNSADGVVHFIAPVLLVVVVFMGYAVLPMGRNMTLVHMDAGLLFYFAMGASTELSVFMAGWSSRNKYSLLGAMRAVAQMISYEVPLLLSSVAVVMITGSLSLDKIVAAQNQYTGDCRTGTSLRRGDSRASCCSRSRPWPRPTARRSICLKASRNWWPATLPSTPGSSLRCSFSANTWACCRSPGWARRCFWADGRRRLSFLGWVPSWFWFFCKVMLSICVFIWMRGTLPRLRQDQLMNFAWKFVLPLTLLNLFVAALWHFLGEGWMRWGSCSAILLAAYVGMAAWACAAEALGPRSYRYAE